MADAVKKMHALLKSMTLRDSSSGTAIALAEVHA